MSNSIFADKRKGPLDLFLILVLMCAFTGFALMIVSIGANAYNNVLISVEDNSQLRLPLTFISNKIHQNDEFGSVSLANKENTTALILKSNDGKNTYEDWIYVYEGNLCELLIKAGDSFSLSSGIKVMTLDKLSMEMKKGNLIKISSFNSKGESLDLDINLRSI
ncbi:MAG: DUF4860 domain-containing protein [Eubacteriales bacterium]